MVATKRAIATSLLIFAARVAGAIATILLNDQKRCLDVLYVHILGQVRVLWHLSPMGKEEKKDFDFL